LQQTGRSGRRDGTAEIVACLQTAFKASPTPVRPGRSSLTILCNKRVQKKQKVRSTSGGQQQQQQAVACHVAKTEFIGLNWQRGGFDAIKSGV